MSEICPIFKLCKAEARRHMVEKTEKQNWNTNNQLFRDAYVHEDTDAMVQGWAWKPKTRCRTALASCNPVLNQSCYSTKQERLLSYKQNVPSI